MSLSPSPVTEICPVCGQPSDGWPDGLCQDHWEDWCSAAFFHSEAGLLPLSDEYFAEWLALRKAAACA